MRVGCVIMAAGNAVRFGSNKLLSVVDGKTMIQRAFDAVPEELFCGITVVTQYQEIVELAEQCGFCAVINRHPEWGISHTIKLGLQSMQDADAVMFLVSDQPLLQRESVEKLVAFYLEYPKKIAAPVYDGQRGNPCIFPAEYFPALLALQGDEGGGAVIRKNTDALRLLDLPSYQLQDIDTIEQLNELNQ